MPSASRSSARWRNRLGWAVTALLWLAAAGSVVLAAGRAEPPPASAATPVSATSVQRDGPAYLTILIARAEWAPSLGCEQLWGAVSLDRVATELAARDMAATAGVVPTETTDTRGCDDGFALRTGWDDLTMLRDRYGWSAIPRSSEEVTGLDDEQRREQTCGARDALVGHGFPGAWGMFAYANNARDEEVQRTLVQACFAYGRSYGSGRNVWGAMSSPWWQTTRSVNGGACTDCPGSPGAAVSTPWTYDTPADLGAVADGGPGTWGVLQFYRFVEGRSLPGSADMAWDCTDPDPSRHWTSRVELYCFDDFLAVLDAIPAEVVVTDPATVATAAGRRPAG